MMYLNSRTVMVAAKPAPRRSALRAAAGTVALAASLEMAVAPAAWSMASLGDDLLAHVAQVSDGTLAQERGKFITPNGLDINLGATITTLVDGRIAMMTTFVQTQTGQMQMTQSVPGPTTNTTPVVSPIGTNAPTTTTSDNGSVVVTPVNAASGADLQQEINSLTNGKATVNVAGVPASPNGLVGVIVTDPNGGVSVAVGTVTPTSALNVIANDADSRTIVQQVQLAVNVNNFSAFQQQLVKNQVSANVLNAMQGFLARGFGH